MIYPRIVCFPFHMGQSRAKIQLVISSDSPGQFRRQPALIDNPWCTIVLPNSYPCTQASKVSISFVGHTAHCGTESEHQALNGSHIFKSLSEYWNYLVLSSNNHVKGVKMKRENNPVRLPFGSWCVFSVLQCAPAYRGNWNSWCLY